MDDLFLSKRNINNLIITSIPLLLVSFAQTIVLLTGGIDLSVGSIISLSNVICATIFAKSSMSYIYSTIFAIAVGAISGYINGLIITKGKLQPIIVTLATSSIIGGTALAVLPSPGGKVNAQFASTVTGDVIGISTPLIIGIVITYLLWLLLAKTPFGVSVYAIGGNENSAFSTGIMVNKVKIKVYVLAGILSAMAGIFLSAQMYSGDPTVGATFTTKAITAGVVGGTSLMGGSGGIIGTIAGAFILVIINNILNFIGVPSFYQYILQGGILIIALAIGSIKTGRY
jgi:ribose/xylose/arabinose/galactoside ABC-type transport system permease subunit